MPTHVMLGMAAMCKPVGFARNPPRPLIEMGHAGVLDGVRQLRGGSS